MPKRGFSFGNEFFQKNLGRLPKAWLLAGAFLPGDLGVSVDWPGGLQTPRSFLLPSQGQAIWVRKTA
jgi:hypothetical protein